jgi:hypothetical protein
VSKCIIKRCIYALCMPLSIVSILMKSAGEQEPLPRMPSVLCGGEYKFGHVA